MRRRCAGSRRAAAASRRQRAPTPAAPPTRTSLRREAMADPSVQALFEIFPVEKTKVEEL